MKKIVMIAVLAVAPLAGYFATSNPAVACQVCNSVNGVNSCVTPLDPHVGYQDCTVSGGFCFLGFKCM